MKKIFSSVTSIVISSVFFVNNAFAQNTLPDPGPIPGLETADPGTAGVIEIILRIIGFILDLVLIVAILYIIIAVISAPAASEEGGEKVRKSILYVIIGIVVIVFARVLVTFADTFFRA